MISTSVAQDNEGKAGKPHRIAASQKRNLDSGKVTKGCRDKEKHLVTLEHSSSPFPLHRHKGHGRRRRRRRELRMDGPRVLLLLLCCCISCSLPFFFLSLRPFLLSQVLNIFSPILPPRPPSFLFLLRAFFISVTFLLHTHTPSYHACLRLPCFVPPPSPFSYTFCLVSGPLSKGQAGWYTPFATIFTHSSGLLRFSPCSRALYVTSVPYI